MSKLASNNTCAEIFKSAKINLSFWGFGLEISGSPQITDKETAITKMMEGLKKHGKRVLLSIDEVTDTPQMKVFASSFQIFVRQELPLFLIMTGLYENIQELQDEKNLTFLYRAPKIEMKALNIRSVAAKYKSIFETDDKTAAKMAKLIKKGILNGAERGSLTFTLPAFEKFVIFNCE